MQDPYGISGSAEVGIIDYNEINAHDNVDMIQKRWVLQHLLEQRYEDNISLTLDMEKRSLNISVNTGYGSYWDQNFQFTAHRVSPFFASSSPNVTITLVG